MTSLLPASTFVVPAIILNALLHWTCFRLMNDLEIAVRFVLLVKPQAAGIEGGDWRRCSGWASHTTSFKESALWSGAARGVMIFRSSWSHHRSDLAIGRATGSLLAPPTREIGTWSGDSGDYKQVSSLWALFHDRQIRICSFLLQHLWLHIGVASSPPVLEPCFHTRRCQILFLQGHQPSNLTGAFDCLANRTCGGEIDGGFLLVDLIKVDARIGCAMLCCSVKSVHMVCLLVGSRLVGWQFDEVC